jgi:hypothetical protein
VWVLELHNIQYVAPSFVVVRRKRSLVVALGCGKRLWLKVRKNGLSFFARSKYLQIEDHRSIDRRQFVSYSNST